MDSIRIETVIESDGVVHLTGLPCHRGDRVEALITLQEPAEERQREAARQRFLARARQSRLRSSGPYPTRDELQERD